MPTNTSMQKRFGGLQKIHIAKIKSDGSGWETPVHIKGAKAVEGTLNYESVQFFADNSIDFQDYKFSGGEGTMTVSGLTPTEFGLLFGSSVEKGGVMVTSADVTPELALLFERDALGADGKKLYAIYACKFAQPSINAQTMEGNIEEELLELSFSIREFGDKKRIYYTVDTTATDAPANVDTKWYTEVQTPETISA